MIRRIANFEKVTFGQYVKDLQPRNKVMAKAEFDRIRMPKRATSGSAGYDMFIPFEVLISPGTAMKIPTGISARIDEGWALIVLPKSGLGTKYRVQLSNTIGLIDSDYHNSDNEGHIMVTLYNDGNKPLRLEAGDKFVQAVFIPYGITTDDTASKKRNGGFGSTGR